MQAEYTHQRHQSARQTPLVRWGKIGGILALLAVVLALIVLLAQPAQPLQIDVGATGDSTTLRNFYQPEQEGEHTFRWTGPGTRVLLPAAYAAQPSRLSLRLNGDYLTGQIATEQAQMEFQYNQRTAASIQLQPGWRNYHILLPPTDATALALVSPVLRPGPTDNRYLGAPIDWLELEPAAHPTPNALFSRVLPWLPWLLGLLGGVALLIGGARLIRLGSTGLRLLALGERRQTLLIWLLPWVVAHFLLFAPLPPEWRGTGAVILLLLPGMLLAWLLFGDETEPLTMLMLSLCGGLALWALLLLALHSLPGPIPGWSVLLCCTGLSGALLTLHVIRTPHSHSATPVQPRLTVSPVWLWLLLVVLAGAGLRFALLGSSEFQGDESRAILMAAGVVEGQDEILLLRPKGPVEVLIPAGLLALSGTMTEWLARLPFALAGCGLLLGVFVLGRQLVSSADSGLTTPVSGVAVGLLAAAVLVLDGFMVAFARLVQYQSVIMLLMVGALWCGWRFYEGVTHPQRYLLSAAVLAAVAMLAHYDGVFVLPALGWFVLAGVWRHWQFRWGAWLRGLFPALLTGAGLLACFYLPFLLNDHFGAETSSYLAYRLRKDDPASLTFNNLPRYYDLATFYSTTYQINALALTLLASLASWLLLLWRRTQGIAALFAATGLGALLVGSLVLVVQPELFAVVDSFNWAIVAFGLPLAVLALLPATPAALRLPVLWFAPTFLAMAFVIGEPRTHFYAMNPPAALLISLAIVQTWHWLKQRSLRWPRVLLASGGALLVLLALPYLYLAFVRQQPEYLRDFPASRPELYRARYGDSLPTDAGYFAFPQRDGWPVVGELFRQGVLQGSYSSNKKPLITNWYMRGLYRCSEQPDHFMIARSESFILPEDYHLTGVILVDERRMLDIYSRAPLADNLPAVYHLRDYRPSFEQQPVASFPTQQFLFEVVPQVHTALTWPNGLKLQGFDLFHQPTGQHGGPTISLYWQVDQQLDPEYDLMVELVDNQGQLVGTAKPTCSDGVSLTQQDTQSIVVTTYTFDLARRTAQHEYALQIGLRQRDTDVWLPLNDGSERAEVWLP